MPTTVATFYATSLPGWVQSTVTYLSPGRPVYETLYALLILFFTFFYTSVVFNPEETADNLKKYGGFIPGIRPGKKTAEYIDYVLTRTTVIGAIYLVVVCLIPELARSEIAIALGGTSILIMVSVTSSDTGIDTSTMSVLRQVCRKISRMKPVARTASSRDLRTVL